MVVCGHINIAQNILHKVNTCPNDISILLLTKMLTQLEIKHFNRPSCRELIEQTKKAMKVSKSVCFTMKTFSSQFFIYQQVVLKKNCKNNLEKFLIQLEQHQKVCAPMETSIEMHNKTETIIAQTESLSLDCEKSNTSKKQITTTSVKRRRRQKGEEVFEQSSTTLRTVIELI